MTTIGEAGPLCPHCGLPTTLVDYDDDGQGHRVRETYECARDGLFGYNNDGKLVFENGPRPLDAAHEWPLKEDPFKGLSGEVHDVLKSTLLGTTAVERSPY